jgi:hypothetical protein
VVATHRVIRTVPAPGRVRAYRGHLRLYALCGMRTLLRTVMYTVVIAAAGFALARYGGSIKNGPAPVLSRQASTPGFRVSFPSGWRLTSASTVPALALSGMLALVPTQANTSEQLVIGTTRTSDPSALPTGFQATLASPSKPQVVTLGSSDFYRYLNVSTRNPAHSESIYTLPTTAGTITAVCSASSPSVTFTSSCERVLATVRVTSGTALSLTAHPGYALELNRILDRLNSVRTSAGSGLASGDVRTRGRAASRLATAHAQAAASAQGITVAGVSAASRPLVAALSMSADAYRALARAAARQDVSGYRRAQASVARATRALDDADAQFRRLGYGIH